MRNGLKLLTAAFALGATVFGAAAANANPIALFYSLDGNNYVPLGTTSTGDGTSVVSSTVTGSTYSISASAIGSPLLPAPNFQSSSISFTSTGPGTLYVIATETGLSTPGVSGFTLGFTNNALSTVAVTESFGLITSPGAFPTIIASQTLAPNTAAPANVAVASLPASYGVAQLYTATFGSTGGVVNATISEQGNFASVPEPVSMSILGVGLAGLGLVRLRRKNTAA